MQSFEIKSQSSQARYEFHYLLMGVSMIEILIGCFYFALGNLAPKYRSQLSTTQFISLVKSSFITTYGIDSILKPLVDDLKKLVLQKYF